MNTRRSVLSAAAVLAAAPRAFAQSRPAPYWPGDGAWATSDAKAAGFDAARLAAAVSAAVADASTSVMVLRDGKIVAEAYGAEGGADKLQAIQSAGKSMTSVLTGCCLDEGKIKSLDQSASDFFPEWKGTPKQAITIRHMITMTSGLDDTGLAVRNVMGDQAALNAAAPLINPPGTRWHYNTPVYHLMFHLVQRAAGEPFEAYAKRKLLDPLGMKSTWLTNQGKDAAGKTVTNYYTANCTARDMARFGLMALAGGAWNGKAVVSPGYFRDATRPSQELNGAYGYLWWVAAKPGHAPADNSPLKYQFEGAPLDTFAALGALGQNVIVVPSQRLVLVRQGGQGRGPALTAPMTAAVIAALDNPPTALAHN